MHYQLLRQRGALQDATPAAHLPSQGGSAIDVVAQREVLSGPRVDPRLELRDLPEREIPQSLLRLVPASIARERNVIPVEARGDLLLVACTIPNDIELADALRAISGLNVRLVKAPAVQIQAAIRRHYREDQVESVDSLLREFTDTAIDFTETAPAHNSLSPEPVSVRSRRSVREFKKAVRATGLTGDLDVACDPAAVTGVYGMLTYVVPEGQRVLARHRDGTFEEIAGPRRGWRGFKVFFPMSRYVAHPGEFLLIRYLNGRQAHIPGPAEVWFDLRQHASIDKQESLQLAAKEAVVVYKHVTGQNADGNDDHRTTRRIVFGPTLFSPQPGEWLHTFSWHASRGGSQGVEKIPDGLVFQKLWLMPDQMYHDVRDVRTSDSAVLTIRLMIFFELVDIERMLDNTHDPIGDFVNAATADVVEFVGKLDFDAFKNHTDRLNDVNTYRQLLGRSEQAGYRINNVVYRGYGAAQSLQQMHDQAIEARTRLQLDRETEQQAQELEDFKLHSQLARTGQRREEQIKESRHTIQLAREKSLADLDVRKQQSEFHRQQQLENAQSELQATQLAHAEQQAHWRSLGELGVDLTRFLTQARADRVIEFRNAGPVSPQVHVDGHLNGSPE